VDVRILHHFPETRGAALEHHGPRHWNMRPAASTFKAVEGLGLKLERRRGPVDVFVVDSMRRTPAEN
jgi:uncharacterized protein (TIGR03435 family)